jgi:hypothetical protein
MHLGEINGESSYSWIILRNAQAMCVRPSSFVGRLQSHRALSLDELPYEKV